MFDRFSDEARKSLGLSRGAAQRYSHADIAAEHILLSLTELPGSRANHILEAARIDTEALRARIEKDLPGPGVYTAGQIPFTIEAKRVLELAVQRADRLGHDEITTGHLLLGVFDLTGSKVREALLAEGPSEDVLDGLGRLMARSPDPDRDLGGASESLQGQLLDIEIQLAQTLSKVDAWKGELDRLRFGIGAVFAVAAIGMLIAMATLYFVRFA